MRTKRWLFVAMLAFSAALLGWGSSLALFKDDPNDLIPIGSTLFNSPVPTPKPTRSSRPTRLPTPRVIPTPRPVPFRDEQGDLIAQEDVGMTPHGQIMLARTKAKTTQGHKYESSDIFAATSLTPTVFLPLVVKPEIYYPKVLVVAYINYFRHIFQALEAYAHSIEYFMQRFVPAGYEACDFRTASKSFYSWGTPSQCSGQWVVSDVYGFTARAWPENSNVGVCGWSHQPPNQTRVPDYTDPDSMYHYLLTNIVQSRCADWQWGGNNTTSFDCYTYGCVLPPPDEDDYVYDLRSEERYLIWWMQNMPGLNNNNGGRHGGPRPNWWTIKWK